MNAAILAIGSELLGTRRLDTNSLRITEALRGFGVATVYKAVVGDSRERIVAEIRRLAGLHELVVVTGGLGPTEDDLTREAIAEALERDLERRQDLVELLRRRFASFGLEMPAVNEKQADVIAGSEVLENRRGTAPGQRVVENGTTIFLFPGVPAELEGMIGRHLVPWLESVGGADDGATATRVLKVACIPESTMEERLAPFYAEFGGEGFSILPSPGEVTLELTATGREEARDAWLDPRRERLREIFGRSVFSEEPEGSLEAVVGADLSRVGETVVTAESCTGGLIAERLTRVAGSSSYFLGAVVSYANEVKISALGVTPEILERHGAVSEETVRAMAHGARAGLGADWAIAVSGVAGPGGGSDEKPVGTVHLAVSGPGVTRNRRLRLPGDRERVRWLASQWALCLLRQALDERR